jgi:patatin-like phospholipase/acyl hydrolase
MNERTRAAAVTLDGGGVRGIATIMVLIAIRNIIKKPIVQCVDMIAGTSTGGITAAQLCAGITEESLVNNYIPQAQKIFPQPDFIEKLIHMVVSCCYLRYPKYSSTGRYELADKTFGNLPMKDSLTDLLITTNDLVTQKPLIYTNYGTPHELFSTAVKATTAAPTYFAPYKHKIDGGMSLNNPAEIAYDELRKRVSHGATIKIFSIGTGNLTVDVKGKDVDDWGLAEWGINIVDILFNLQSNEVDRSMRERMDQRNKDGLHGHSFTRIQKNIPPDLYALDNPSPEVINGLKKFGKEMAEDQDEQVRDFCKFVAPEVF